MTRYTCFLNKLFHYTSQDPSPRKRFAGTGRGIVFVDMRRVARPPCEDAPIPEEQETEGQRQLHSLLLQQLDTEADIERCVAKRRCFAPAALYRPFGEQAAGVRSLTQFRALQDGEQELASLRELGLTEPEMQLWRTRDLPEAGGKSGGIRAAPGARQQRLQVIREKMAAREQLLSLPQRLSASRPLSRREMEIERALFHGSERLGFLSALYHQEEAAQSSGDSSSSSGRMDQVYRDVLKDETLAAPPLSVKSEEESPSDSQLKPESSCDQKQRQNGTSDPRSTDAQTQGCPGPDPAACQTEDLLGDSQKPAGHTQCPMKGDGAPLARQRKISASQPIGRLDSVTRLGPGGPLAVSGSVEHVSEDQIRENRETEAGIRSIPRFQNYQRGEPSEVLCVRNLSPRASLSQLVSLFSRFQPPPGPPLLYRLLTGRLKGQAFITFPDTQKAEAALDLLNGYRLLEKPLVIEFRRGRRDEEREGGRDEQKERDG
ncbi:RNA-binding protein 41 [Conger conger]|uniref:RNA-binding protein 41 n=1 Tax=Conger conger TaxID=82655 RepID=UPI002A5A4AA7|nr:RNA-binding protein 41 [Conger conger]